MSMPIHPSSTVRSEFLLCLVDMHAARPRCRLDQPLNLVLDARAQVARVHRVELPASIAIALREPGEALVFLLVRCREGWQPV